ncbi:hypothetical protein D5S18_27110 [Nocardia panacis]|uniref:Uncharacterized protein n=2 Tax=Nocardia panacis TaxID=2340916 RepID=A0A3A4KEZ6_9NOCA|nr:hypothetical protein D5S18_27110 [Nocardia panacis]
MPRVYQSRDDDLGGPLRALLGVITEQADLIEADIERLAEDWFVETCQDWVLPYLGDLVGFHAAPASAEALAAGTEEARKLLAALAARRDVGHTVRNRRRKGTLAVLEDLAADAAAWPARAVEFRRLLGLTQAIRLWGRDPRADARRLHRGRLADLREVDVLDRVDGPFDALAHTVDVRRINSPRGQGRYNIPELGLFVWRLRPYSVTGAPAFSCHDRARAHFTFSILGNDAPLITAPDREPEPAHIAEERDVPAFIRRLAFRERTADYYGPGKSLCLYTAAPKEGDPPIAVPLERIVAADLTDWVYRPKPGQVAVDPVLGRIAFPAGYAPDTGVWVDYHYGFSDDLGGGEYHRPLKPAATVYTVGTGGQFTLINAALRQWNIDKSADPERREAVIELVDSGAYQEQLEIKLEDGDRLTLRAAQRKRPVLRLLDWYSNRPDALRLIGPDGPPTDAPPAVVTLDGLLITGRSVRMEGRIGVVGIRHCTLVPGWSLDDKCCPEHEEEPSLELLRTTACLQVDRSILGTIIVEADETHREPNRIWLSDSIIDATDDCLAAIVADDDGFAFATVSARRCTVFGAVRVHAAELFENSILTGEVCVARRQQGCFRFCWLPPGSRTPAQFHCEPAHSGDPIRVVPRFTRIRYGTPGYAQLAAWCPDEIVRGADDDSEMGVFHDLFQPQRTDTLRLRLDEFTPAGTDSAILFVT